jgi:Mechanosensitive ion channel, conserved TM helix
MSVSFSERLLGALNSFYEGVMRFLPGLLAALVILALGLVVGWLLKLILKRVLAAARFDRLADSLGATQVLSRADVRSTPSALAAAFVFWVVFLSFLMAGLSALQIHVIDQLTTGFFLYLPRIFAALLILLAGFLLGNFLSRASLLGAVNAGLPSPRGISLVVKLLIAILAFAMALEQLQIARSIVLAAFVITFGAVMLGLAIAFGTGGKDVARQVLERQLERKPPAGEADEISHV